MVERKDDVEWPESVPVLTADDMCKGALSRGRRRCLLGWCREVALGDDSGIGPYSSEQARAHDCLIGAVMQQIPPGYSIPRFNDNVPPERAAEAWNAAVRSLGYTEVEEVDA